MKERWSSRTRRARTEELLGLFGGRFAFRSDFGDRVLEFSHVLEALVDGGEADIGNLVEALEFAHDQFADVAGRYLARTAGEQVFLDAVNGVVNRGGWHRTL